MNYPLRVLSLGAGVQSSTVLRMSIRGELPKFDAGIFADTFWEPRAVYEHLARLTIEAESAGIPILRVWKGNLREAALNGKVTRSGLRYSTMPFHVINKSNPNRRSMANRQCTFHYKIKPIQQALKWLCADAWSKRQRRILVEQYIGISWDESSRMKPSRDTRIENKFPLIDMRMTRQDCIKWTARHGFSPSPRSACLGCPYQDDVSWRRIKSNPEEWDDVVRFDRDVRESQGQRNLTFLHRSCLPIDEVDFSTAEERGQLTLGFGNECEGMCGV